MFDGNEGSKLNGRSETTEASNWTRTFQTANRGKHKAHFFGKNTINDLLNSNPEVVGIRMYMGEDDEGNTRLVLVGADKDGNDLDSYMVDRSAPCPTFCGPRNSLNHDL